MNEWRTVGTIMPVFNIGKIEFGRDFPEEYAYMINELLNVWAAKLWRNQIKYRYYDGKNVLKDFGISIPPSLLNVETVVGWPQKAVDAMAVRSRFDGFTAIDPEVQAILDGIAAFSRIRVKYRQAVQSTLIHSCCFATVTMDDNRPRIDLYSAENASAVWDDAKGRIAYGMVINEFTEGAPSKVTLHCEDAVVTAWDTGAGFWEWSIEPIAMGRPTMDVFTYRPTYRKPFGQSRITRAVMSITDSAVREALRAEISAEFFTSPQKYLLGVDKDVFDAKPRWSAYLGAIMAVSKDSDGDIPKFGQLPQGSMQPHTDYFRSLAARFSGETNVPISTLGVIHDNPASAEAIYAASEPLIIECEDFNDGARETLRTLALMAIAGAVDVPMYELDERYYDFTPNFRNPAMPSIVSQTDAMVKLASVVDGFAGTDVFFEQVGFSEDMRRKAENEIRRNQSAFSLGAILNSERVAESVNNAQTADAPTVEDAAATPIEEARTLNGAQTQSLLSVIDQVKSGALSQGQAINIISLSCGISKDDARAILEGK